MKYIVKNIFRISIIAACLFPAFIKGASEIGDTIHVVTLEEFSVPSNKHIVLTNIKNISFDAELLDMQQNVLRKCTNSWQDPAASEFPVKGARGKLVQFSLKESIADAGEYYIRVKIHYSDERQNNNLEVLYKVFVDYPKMGSEINLRDKYFYSEEETFSFTTLEFREANEYSYQITDIGGAIIDTGRGSVINLNKVMQDENNVGKKIIVNGYYKGKEFSYKDAKTGDVKKSSWEFDLLKPEMDEFVAWKKSDDKGYQVLSIYNEKAMNLLYLYVGRTPTGFVVMAPKIRNLVVTSEPANFLKNYSSTIAGKFLFVKLEVNDEFVQNMEQCGEADVNINLRFTTQFNEKVTRNYSATVIK